MKLVIMIPLKSDKSGIHYAMRWKACQETWLANPAVDFKGLSDADLGLNEINQHDNEKDPIRTHRMIEMTRWAFENGYDYMFRTDTDAYVWTNRLAACGFEKYDYMGYCRDRDQPRFSGRPNEWCVTNAHGGIGFFLSRKAMEVILRAPVEKYADGKYWGDLWAGHQLWKKGIHCQRDTRFLDGGRTGVSSHHGNILAEELPDNHPYVSIHPVNPIENFYAIHERFKDLPAETIAPKRQLWDQEL